MHNPFTTSYQELVSLIDRIDPVEYAKSRNYISGAVTRLSPYISRGILSTAFVYRRMVRRGFALHQMEKFVQELAWRDYFQLVWNAKGDAINQDLKHTQSDKMNHELPVALSNAATGIIALDDGIRSLYETGYMHNHLRMYTASVATNVARSHWLQPARWMYYHLLDADWASNALSWQWVAGAFSSKKYVANQENINRYAGVNQHGTFLDCEYEELPPRTVPDILKETHLPEYHTPLPPANIPVLKPHSTVALYTAYNLDPLWRAGESCERVLLLEPSFFQRYPMCGRTIDFICAWADAIPGMQVAVCEFSDLRRANPTAQFVFKQHPSSTHFTGVCDEREWLAPDVTGYYPSFFAFWKHCEKGLKKAADNNRSDSPVSISATNHISE
ncbi:MAG: deoxyribodipyrimidine photolyase [Candidatus Kapabacteria bacterium]|nr:deoxyribodipyrimidine photolyase [Candidatus Kapabacteria bacterium]